MIKESIATGKTLEEAKENALASLGNYDTDDIGFEVLTQPKAKTLGLFGGCDAKVRVFVEVEDEDIVEETKASEVVETEKKEVVKSAVMTDENKEKVINYLTAILENMGIENVKIDVQIEEDGTKINFDGDKLGVAIGRKGETLDAIQHLVSLVANKGQSDYVRITLNPGGYRQKREEILIALAKKNAIKAKKFNKNVILEAMNSYERRIIHNAVQEVEGVMSWSIGENDHRRVVIGTSKDNKPFRENRGGRGRGGKGGYNKGGYNKGGYNRSRKPSQYSSRPHQERAPKSDSSDLPLYGVIK